MATSSGLITYYNSSETLGKHCTYVYQFITKDIKKIQINGQMKGYIGQGEQGSQAKELQAL